MYKFASEEAYHANHANKNNACFIFYLYISLVFYGWFNDLTDQITCTCRCNLGDIGSASGRVYVEQLDYELEISKRDT